MATLHVMCQETQNVFHNFDVSYLRARCVSVFLSFLLQAGDGVKKKAKKARTSKNSSGGNKKRGGVKEEAPIVGERRKR